MLRSTSNTSLCFHPERTGIILYFLAKNSYSPPGDRRHSQPHYSLAYDLLGSIRATTSSVLLRTGLIFWGKAHPIYCQVGSVFYHGSLLSRCKPCFLEPC